MPNPPLGMFFPTRFNDAFVKGSDTTPYLAAWHWNRGWGTRYSNGTALANFPSPVVTTNDKSVVGAGTSSSPYIEALEWSDGFGTKYADPATLPLGQVRGMQWDASDDAVIATDFNGGGAKSLFAYAWSSSGFGSKYADPAPLSNNRLRQLALSNDGTTVVLYDDSNPNSLIAWPWSSSTGFGTKYSDPATASTVRFGNSIVWDASDSAVIAGGAGATSVDWIQAYEWSSGFGTKYAAPATAPNGAVAGLAFDNKNSTIGLNQFTNDFCGAYPWSSGSGFGTKYAAPASLPAYGGGSPAWADDGQTIIHSAGDPGGSVYAYQFNNGYGTAYPEPSSPEAGNGATVI